jgi:hypothetical protein
MNPPAKLAVLLSIGEAFLVEFSPLVKGLWNKFGEDGYI